MSTEKIDADIATFFPEPVKVMTVKREVIEVDTVIPWGREQKIVGLLKDLVVDVMSGGKGLIPEVIHEDQTLDINVAISRFLEKAPQSVSKAIALIIGDEDKDAHWVDNNLETGGIARILVPFFARLAPAWRQVYEELAPILPKLTSPPAEEPAKSSPTAEQA